MENCIAPLLFEFTTFKKKFFEKNKNEMSLNALISLVKSVGQITTKHHSSLKPTEPNQITTKQQQDEVNQESPQF